MDSRRMDTRSAMDSASGELCPLSLHETFPDFYGELRELARRHLGREPRPPTLEPTALVHEAFLRLRQDRKGRWASVAEFLAAAAVAMRRVLIDRARRRRSQKRGGGRAPLRLSEVSPRAREVVASEEHLRLLDLEEAMARLAEIDPVKGAIVILRFLWGQSVKECAAALSISEAKVKADWAFARAWLEVEVRGR